MKKENNKFVYEKLMAVIKEFDNRVEMLPLSKKGLISQDWSFLKAQSGNIETMFKMNSSFGGVYASQIPLFADQICSYAAKIYTELSK